MHWTSRRWRSRCNTHSARRIHVFSRDSACVTLATKKKSYFILVIVASKNDYFYVIFFAPLDFYVRKKSVHVRKAILQRTVTHSMMKNVISIMLNTPRVTSFALNAQSIAFLLRTYAMPEAAVTVRPRLFSHAKIVVESVECEIFSQTRLRFFLEDRVRKLENWLYLCTFFKYIISKCQNMHKNMHKKYSFLLEK